MILKNGNADLLMISLSDKEQEEEIYRIIDSNYSKDTRICYLLIRTAFEYFHDGLKKREISSNLHIIDLFGNFRNPSNANVTTLSSLNLPEILAALEYKIKKERCNMIIIDTISQLLHYLPRHEIQTLTNCLKTLDAYRDTKKIFLFSSKDDLVQEESCQLYSDLLLFTDKVITN
jgi:hypothetical protein